MDVRTSGARAAARVRLWQRVTQSEEHRMSDGTADETKGRLKEAAGDLTGDEDLKNEGKVDKASGKAKKAIGDIAGKAKNVLRKN
jgi:uncharacterized protein YjbJ (UPF0337 family)